MNIIEIKCIYCNLKPSGMICTGDGYACPNCLLSKIDKLQIELDILRPKFKAADECCTEREITILGQISMWDNLGKWIELRCTHDSRFRPTDVRCKMEELKAANNE